MAFVNFGSFGAVRGAKECRTCSQRIIRRNKEDDDKPMFERLADEPMFERLPGEKAQFSEEKPLPLVDFWNKNTGFIEDLAPVLSSFPLLILLLFLTIGAFTKLLLDNNLSLIGNY
ncbi:hypothetical protein NDN08_002454 [Rhodosorus marinus]|uniref:Uncharacterized protein n=1 Tax=Rhodosorus marinus TaxID=101924 RepID=A0AAV8UWJ0_9RHOD|nr:hypothetical protein NDN08_002454 [Rhodosorus marinus]